MNNRISAFVALFSLSLVGVANAEPFALSSDIVTKRDNGTTISNPVTYVFYQNDAVLAESADPNYPVDVENILGQKFCIQAVEKGIKEDGSGYVLSSDKNCVTFPDSRPAIPRLRVQITLDVAQDADQF